MLNRKAVIIFFLSGVALLCGIGAKHLVDTSDSVQTIVARISQNLETELKAVDSEANQLMDSDEESTWQIISHSFFLLDSVKILRWNRSEFLPDPGLMQGNFKVRLFQSSRGSFILKKWKSEKQISLLSVISLREKYDITNRYLVPSWNQQIFGDVDVDIVDPTSDEGYPIRIEGSTLFKVRFSQLRSDGDSTSDLIILVSGWISILLFSIGLYLLIISWHHRARYELAFMALLTGLILIRVVMISFNFPRDYSTLFIFDPLQFASSSLNPSIADLFFNTISVLLCGVYVFCTYYRWSFIRKISVINAPFKFSMAVISLLLCFYTMLFPFLFFETISHNSNISLDISQSINFDLIRVLAFSSIVMGSVSAFLFCHVFFKIGNACTRHSRSRFFTALLTAVIIFYLGYKISDKEYVITLLSGLSYVVIVYLAGLGSSLKRFSYYTFLYFFVAILLLAVQGSFSVKQLTAEKTREDQFKFASNFLVGRDILGEYLLNETVIRITEDPFIQSRMATPFFAKSVVRQKINQLYLNSYFDRYEVQVYLYNTSGDSYDNQARENFAKLVKTFQEEANKTTYSGIYFIESPNQESAKRYLAIVPIKYHGPAGYVVLDLTLKKLIPQNVFPELLVDNQFINYFKNTDFSYAFYLNKRLISNSGAYNYERNFNLDWLGTNALYTSSLEADEFTHIGMEDDLGRVAVVSSPDYPWMNSVAGFAFLFVLGLCCVLFLLIVFTVVLWIKGERLNYAARIQTYIYLAFLLPLMAVSVTTLSLISKSEESELKSDFLAKSKIIGDRLGVELDLYNQSEEASKSEFERQLLNLTRLANLDASVFSNEGQLIASSQPLIYQNQLVSNLVDREAWVRIAKEKEASFVKNDAIGKLSFNTTYTSLKSPATGDLIGVLSIPFFDSAHSLEKTQINVWSNILIIFVVVFLLFSFVSFFIVNWLTFPLRFITRTLGKTTFSGENKPLVWKSKDEIGLMVGEYNRMLENLERSKIELSRIQKESAWREIAKQVAHEINNPLTPMKLTLQRMELAYVNGSLTKEDAEKSLKTLLTQVEILNQIASSFSAFARMPAPVLQKVDIYQVLKKVVDLHTNQLAANIYFPAAESVFILGDEQLLIRVFSNVVLNALQSVEENRKVKVEIEIKIEDNVCLISIADNGNGIDDDLKEKVFLPHFSTKKTGSGIGLAIAKQGIELSGGEIWFDSKVDQGTTFHVKLPLWLKQ